MVTWHWVRRLRASKRTGYAQGGMIPPAPRTRGIPAILSPCAYELPDEPD